MSARWLFCVLLLGLVGCRPGAEAVVWSEPLVAASDGGVLTLTKVAARQGDVVEQQCASTRLAKVSATFDVRTVERGSSRLCAATQAGNIRTGLDEQGRLVFADMSDRGRLKVSLPGEDGTTVLMDGCVENDPVLAGDSPSRRVAIYLAGCERDRGSWVHILQLAPDFRSVMGEDSVRMESPPRGMSFGPQANSLLAHVREGDVDRIVILDLVTHNARVVTSGRLPASQSRAAAFVFVRDEDNAPNDWLLMFSDSVGATARAVLSRRLARVRIGDSNAVNLSAPIMSLDSQSIWVGFGGKVLRVQLTTGDVDVVAP